MGYFRAKKSIIWSVFFYATSLFAILYLKEKEEILNWDTVFVFIPLIFLAFSSESFSKSLKDEIKKLRPYCYIDFAVKFVSFIISQAIYRRLLVGEVFFYLLLVLFVLCVFTSGICSFLMIKRTKN